MIEFDRVELFSNTQNTASPEPGVQVNSYPLPFSSVTVDPQTAQRISIPTTGEERFDVGLAFTVTPSVDSWYVVVVSTTGTAKDLWPVAPGIKITFNDQSFFRGCGREWLRSARSNKGFKVSCPSTAPGRWTDKAIKGLQGCGMIKGAEYIFS
jgi:hypothetical protein